MLINKRTYLLIVLMLALTMGKAQLSVNYSMAPLSSFGKSMSFMAGDPLVFDAQGKCLGTASGMRALAVTLNNTGNFGQSCKETTPQTTVMVELTNLNLFPNPTHNLSILKCDGQFDAGLFCQVKVISIDGRVMLSQMVAMKDLQAGYTINASTYVAGNYVVTVDYMSQHFAKKLIKL